MLLVGIGLVRPQSLRVNRRQLLRLALQGLGGSLLTGLLFYKALELLDASLSILLLYAYPALVTLGAVWFRHEPLNRWRLAALILTLGGAAMAAGFVPLRAGFAPSLGIVCGLGAALAYSFQILVSEANLAEMEAGTVMVYSNLFSTIGLMVLRNPARLFPDGVTPFLVIFGLTAGLVCSVAPFYLLMRGIGVLGSSRASIASTLELPFTLLLAVLVLGESVSAWQVLGGGLIISGVYALSGERSAVPAAVAGESRSG